MTQERLFSLACITGASSGIGEALCHLLAEKGIDLIIAGRNIDKLNQLASQLKVRTRIVSGDLSLADDRKKLIEVIYKETPDLMINNAGFGLYGDALTFETPAQMEILKLNIDAVVEMSLESARAMISKDKRGVILNVSSAAAFQILPGFTLYAASKGFVNQFSESLNEELQPYGVSVLAACPGMVATNFRKRASEGKAANELSSLVMTPSFAAEQIWQQIQKRKSIHTFNWKYRLGTFLTQYIIPKKWAIKLVRSNIQSRLAPRPIIKK